MRILAVVFAAITTNFAIYCWQFETYDFSGTRWRCSETKAGFTSAAYRQYQSIEEYTTIYFPSNTSVIYYQSGMLNHKSGLKEPFELVLTATNEVNGQRIQQKFNSVDWNLTPTESPLFTRDKDSLVDFKSDLNYFIQDERLFFFNTNESEDVNIACHKV
ncbi:hypothetical protein [Vibrio campbellii]|uniref:Uncharacterized protein n=1 Tax=Vibrio campbellii TaxID=680 RepID=A0ABY5IGB1_9VIBR|nr:hypothetical protein [Vibrio campbellii]UTZ24543.1 hypothetical protein HB760_22800 [Vibrio campbellii]UTZ33322.1 hypothetical protein HB762_18660 [Vibrio campbellii]